jgi:hypothetical protein
VTSHSFERAFDSSSGGYVEEHHQLRAPLILECREKRLVRIDQCGLTPQRADHGLSSQQRAAGISGLRCRENTR